MFIFFEECLFIQANTHEESRPRTGLFGNCFFHAFRIFYAHKVDHKVINALKCDIKTLQGNTTKFLLRGLAHSTHNATTTITTATKATAINLFGAQTFFRACSLCALRCTYAYPKRSLAANCTQPGLAESQED